MFLLVSYYSYRVPSVWSTQLVREFLRSYVQSAILKRGLSTLWICSTLPFFFFRCPIQDFWGQGGDPMMLTIAGSTSFTPVYTDCLDHLPCVPTTRSYSSLNLEHGDDQIHVHGRFQPIPGQESPIQVLIKHNMAGLQGSHENWSVLFKQLGYELVSS